MVDWAREFARIIQCQACSSALDRSLLRDELENVPQPGWVGANYESSRLLLVGQNPGTPKSLETADLPYTEALRALAANPSNAQYVALADVLRSFIPQWPVHGSYFPLSEANLTLEDIAYCNVVRCRTIADTRPGVGTTCNCLTTHFTHWLALLQPRAVVFIGKWASEHAAHVVAAAGIPHMFMNRQRSLASNARAENRDEAIRFVRKHSAA